MNKLHKAYITLGLEPGTPLAQILARYKKLLKAWHPDRFGSKESKLEAEEELKKINNAVDILKEHFNSNTHTEIGNCECRYESQIKKADTKTNLKANHKKAKPQNKSQNTDKNSNNNFKQQDFKQTQSDHIEVLDTFEKAMRFEATYVKRNYYYNIAKSLLALFLIEAGIGLFVNLRQIYINEKAWLNYQTDKRNVAYAILGEYILPKEIEQWRPPYACEDGSDLQRKIYLALNKPKQNNLPPQIQIQNLLNNNNDYLNNKINYLKYQNITSNNQIEHLTQSLQNIQNKIDEQSNIYQSYKDKANQITKLGNIDFINDSSAKRNNPYEYSQWQSYFEQAQQALKDLNSLNSQKSNLNQNIEHLQSQIIENQNEINQLESKLNK